MNGSTSRLARARLGAGRLRRDVRHAGAPLTCSFREVGSTLDPERLVTLSLLARTGACTGLPSNARRSMDEGSIYSLLVCPADDTIQPGVACARCRYDLGGLALRSACPECGARAWPSIRLQRRADHADLRRSASGYQALGLLLVLRPAAWMCAAVVIVLIEEGMPGAGVADAIVLGIGGLGAAMLLVGAWAAWEIRPLPGSARDRHAVGVIRLGAVTCPWVVMPVVVAVIAGADAEAWAVIAGVAVLAGTEAVWQSSLGISARRIAVHAGARPPARRVRAGMVAVQAGLVASFAAVLLATGAQADVIPVLLLMFGLACVGWWAGSIALGTGLMSIGARLRAVVPWHGSALRGAR
ncbi:MAG: hypothetical protein KF817_09100 [Phycisphaeraceae bacterium]|nr:hypothetical protein [Phycisphaeraceae bacterium]